MLMDHPDVLYLLARERLARLRELQPAPRAAEAPARPLCWRAAAWLRDVAGWLDPAESRRARTAQV